MGRFSNYRLGTSVPATVGGTPTDALSPATLVQCEAEKFDAVTPYGWGRLPQRGKRLAGWCFLYVRITDIPKEKVRHTA